MKIYTITNPVEGMHEPTYDEVLLSGYTAGYESGYADGQEECRPDYSKEYFTIEALEDGEFIVRKSCNYSINDGEWVAITGETAITLNDGDKVRFKGENWVYTQQMFSGNTIQFSVYGNIMSLNYGDDYEDKTRFLRRYDWMFYESTGLVDASNLILPAMELTDNISFVSMFKGCTSLVKAPELPATSLTNYCYSNMFYGCASLVSAPVLPATILTQSCYSFMFVNCTSLTTAPELPSIDLADGCYQGMFSGCASLVQASELPATTLANNCYSTMFQGCTSLTTAPELPATTLASDCYNAMFQGCTSLTTAPELLPATSLADYCYQGMFWGCTSLEVAPVLPAGTLSVSSCYVSMFRDCTSLSSITCLATNPDARFYTSNWVDGVAATGTFVKAAGVTWPSGISGIPSGWSVVEE